MIMISVYPPFDISLEEEELISVQLYHGLMPAIELFALELGQIVLVKYVSEELGRERRAYLEVVGLNSWCVFFSWFWVVNFAPWFVVFEIMSWIRLYVH